MSGTVKCALLGQRINASTCHFLHGAPNVGQGVDNLLLAGRAYNQERTPLPITHSYMQGTQCAIDDTDPMGTLRPSRRCKVAKNAPSPAAPVVFTTESSTYTTHGRMPLLQSRQTLLRGERFAKSSAISSIVTNFTPGCDFM
jgi:hypothetical protein